MFSIGSYLNLPFFGTSQSPYTRIKVKIWQRNTNAHAAPESIHAAIQLYGQHQAYISFWNSSQCGCGRTGTPHFHSKQIDKNKLGRPSQKYTIFLETQKILDAYKKVHRKCTSIKSLGSGIVYRPYPLDNPGVTVFLLDQGGIFKFTSYNRDYLYSGFLKTTSLIGLASSGLNFMNFELFSVDNPLLPASYSYAHFFSMVAVAGSAEMTHEIANLGPEFASEVKASLIEGFMKFNGKDMLDHVKWDHLCRYFKARMTVAKDISKVSKYGFAIGAGALTMHFLIRRFAFSDFTCSDIERIVRKTQKIQANHTY